MKIRHIYNFIIFPVASGIKMTVTTILAVASTPSLIDNVVPVKIDAIVEKPKIFSFTGEVYTLNRSDITDDQFNDV